MQQQKSDIKNWNFLLKARTTTSIIEVVFNSFIDMQVDVAFFVVVVVDDRVEYILMMTTFTDTTIMENDLKQKKKKTVIGLIDLKFCF